MISSDVLDHIFTHLADLGRDLADRRLPGHAPGEIEAALGDLGLAAPRALVDLYTLGDGIAPRGREEQSARTLFPLFHWMGLDEAVGAYRSLKSSGLWNAKWFPVFADGHGDYFAVICDFEHADFGCVVGFILGEAQHIVEFRDLGVMLESIEGAYAEGAFRLEAGVLEADYDRAEAIVRRLQPDFTRHYAPT